MTPHCAEPQVPSLAHWHLVWHQEVRASTKAYGEPLCRSMVSLLCPESWHIVLGGSTAHGGAAYAQDAMEKGLCSWREVLASSKAHIWTEESSASSASDTAASCSSSCSTKCLPCKLSIPCQLLVLHHILSVARTWDLSCQFSPYCWISTSQTQEKWVLLGQTMLNDVTLRMRWGQIDHCACV